MDCLAILDSGNYAYHLCRVLEKKGFVFEVISTPCQIARDGCGYCLKFPIEYKELVISEGSSNNTPVRHMYSITPLYSKNRYDRIY